MNKTTMETIKPNKMDLPPVTIDEPFSLVSIVGTLDDESVVFDGIGEMWYWNNINSCKWFRFSIKASHITSD